MTYAITFLEGIFSFLSPCMLPMLPVYLSYFAAGGERGWRGQMARILAFMLGFTLTFLLLGLLFSTLGQFFARWRTAVNLVCGLVMILFGLSAAGVIRLPLAGGAVQGRTAAGLASAFVFGVVYSVNLTPCVGVFLGSALLLAASAGSTTKGAALLLLYSLGLGVPFLLSALLAGRLDELFRGIKRHYDIFNRICGGFLIAVGALIACGGMDTLIALLN